MADHMLSEHLIGCVGMRIQSYFRCLDSERGRAFEEAREVSEDYGRFLQLVGD